MNSKAIRKQLLAAVAMVLVAAVALGSSTYAWFVNNSMVTAKGMDVQAVAEGGIMIALKTGGTAGTYASSATAGMTAGTSATLLPTSTSNVTDWWHATAVATNAATADESTYVKVSADSGYTAATDGIGQVSKTVGTDTVTENYYLAKTFNIKSSSAAKLASKLMIDSVTVSSTQALSKSLRVAVKVGTNAPLFFAPCEGDATNSVCTAFTPANGDTPASVTRATVSNNTGKTQIATAQTGEISADTGVDVVIYTYFEGEDTNHYSDHLVGTDGVPITLENLDVTVQFSATT